MNASMVSLKTLIKPHIISTLLRHQNPLPRINPHRKLSTNTQPLSSDFETNESENNKPLSVLFKEAVGLTEKTQWGCNATSEDEDEKVHQVKKLLKKIEADIRSMKGMKNLKKKENLEKKKPVPVPVSVGLYSMFTSEPKKLHSMFYKKEKVEKEIESEVRSVKGGLNDTAENKTNLKKKDEQELKATAKFSPEMALFVKCLYEKGYLKGANFLHRGELDLDRLSTVYARGYLRSAAERFGKDHQELAKCLSESDMKRLALFGCPEATHKTAYAAKRLRSYFSIQEDLVCRPCKLKSSCKYKYDTDLRKINDLNIVDVMRVLTLYTLDLGPPELMITDELKDSISRLRTQVVMYSQ